MAILKRSLMSLIILLLSPCLVQGRRILSDENCDGLKTGFDDHYARLQSGDHTGVLVQSISLLRTLRRANDKGCDWADGQNVDVAAATDLAGRYLRGNPCYEQTFAAMRYAESQPEEEREAAIEDAMAILFSDGGCTRPRSSFLQHRNGVWSDENCDELKVSFADRYARLQSNDHTSVLVQSITLLRTLRRANANSCDWVDSAEVDASTATDLAGKYLRGNPCYEQVFAAMRYAESQPEAEREDAMQDAMAILLSDGGCTMR